MENFKFIVISIIILAVLGFGGYWAFSTIESGSTHSYNQKIRDLQKENERLAKETNLLKSEVALLESKNEEILQAEDNNIQENIAKEVPVKVTQPTKTTISKNQDLINKLQKMVDDNIYLKLKSKGAMVGSIQEFFNIYNKTSVKIDNDFGVKLETAVRNFQKSQGVAVSGQVGPNTLKKMITWLKSH